MSVQVFHCACRKMVPGLSRHFQLVFLDPPFGIGLDHDGYQDDGGDELLHRLISEAMEVCWGPHRRRDGLPRH